jgi:ABC-2 type transport system ATP-binding protein
MTGSTVTLRGLTKRYPGRRGVLALDHVDLDIPAGAIVGLLGPNGAGKTTALRLLVGLASPTEGTIEIDGAARADLRGTRLRSVGWLSQEPGYYGWMRGRELVELAARLDGLAARTARAEVDRVMSEVGLADAADRRISTYSGGMRQRLGLAQALVARPPLLVLDEPVSALDPEGRRDVLTLIERQRGASTVVFSTHLLGDIERICDRVAILSEGRLLADAALPELLARHALPIYRLVPEPGQPTAMADLVASLQGLGWVERVVVSGETVSVHVADEAQASRSLLPSVASAGLRLTLFERVRPDLEDVFLRIVGERPAPA